MQCQHASKIWFGSKLGINFNNSHADFIEWVCYALNTLKDEDLSYLAAITYGIWFARNQKIYELRDIEDSIIIDKANSSIKESTGSQYQQSKPAIPKQDLYKQSAAHVSHKYHQTVE
jgi:hypothetical protein